MDLQTLLTMINTVGFPIACVAVLAWYVKTLTDNHKKEVDALTEQINRMNDAIEKIADRLDLIFKGENSKNENK